MIKTICQNWVLKTGKNSTSIYIKESVCTYLPMYLFMPELPDQSPPNFVQTSPPTQGRFLAQA